MRFPSVKGFRFAPARFEFPHAGRYRSAGILCLLVLMTVVAGVARAQATSTQPQQAQVPTALAPESMQALVSKLSPSQTAALVELVELLGSGADKAPPGAPQDNRSVREIVKAWFDQFGADLKRQSRSFPQMANSVGKALAAVFQGRDGGGNLEFLLLLALAIAIGAAAEWWFKRFTSKRRELIRQSRPDDLIDTLKVLSARAGIEIGRVIVFALSALIAINLLITNDYHNFLASSFVLSFIVVVRMTIAIMHFVLAPKRPELRLVYTDNWTARFIERNILIIVAIVGAGFFINDVMLANSIPNADTLRFWLGLSMHSWLIFVVLKSRRGLTRIIEGDVEDLTEGLKRMAAWWPFVAAGLVAFNWFFLQFVLSIGNESLTPERSALAITLIVLAPFLDTIVRSVAAHLVPSGENSSEVVANAYQHSRHSYVRIGRIILISMLILIVGKLWGVNLRNLAEAGFGAHVATHAVSFLLILAFGYLAWEVTNLAISKKLASEAPAEGGGAEGGAGQTRMATILPILRMTLQATIIIITTLLALSQLGVNIAPLLAGAGVLGLAIGFGAQTLVKDIVSGIFFLMDDAFRVGEFITVGNTMGMVSKISVRSLQLRQDTGQLHIIPYGSMSQLTNNSRDWVTLKLRFTVPFDTDQDQVRKIFKKIGQDMMEVPELAEVLINPFKSQGAADVTDVGIVMRGKFSTVPGGQFVVRKEVYSRVQKEFEAAGIEFARKEVRVRMPESEHAGHLSDNQKKAAAAAASVESEAPAKS